MEYDFNVGDKVKVKSPCSNAEPGVIYTLKPDSFCPDVLICVSKTGEETCTCQYNWILQKPKKPKKSKLENPKEKAGEKKICLHNVPPRVLMELALALEEGAKKYGPYNFRDAGVKFSTYYSSTFRHLAAWFEGEDIDIDSGLSHVTKAIAGLVVLRDSMLEGNAIDDRPKKSEDGWLNKLNDVKATE